MPNRIEVTITTTENVTEVIQGIRAQVPEIEKSFRRAGNEVDSLSKRIIELSKLTGSKLTAGDFIAIRDRDLQALRTAHQELSELSRRQADAKAAGPAIAAAQREITAEREREIKAIERQRNMIERLAQAEAARMRAAAAAPPEPRLPPGPIRGPILVDGLSTRTGTEKPSQTNRLLQTQFDFSKAVKESRDYETVVKRVTQVTPKAFEEMQKLEKAAEGGGRGLAVVRNALLRVADVPQSRAIGSIVSLSAGSTVALAGAGILAVGAAIAVGTKKMADAAIEELHRVEKEANRLAPGSAGLKTFGEVTSQTDEIRKFLFELDKGRAQGVFPNQKTLDEAIIRLTGEKVKEPTGGLFGSESLPAYLAAGLRRVPAYLPQYGVLPLLTQYLSDDRAKEGGRNRERELRDQFALQNREQLTQQLKESQRSFDAEGQILPGADISNNPLAQAQKRLREAAGDVNTFRAVKPELEALNQQIIEGAKNTFEWSQDVDRLILRIGSLTALQQNITAQAEQARAAFKQQDEQFKNTLQGAREAIRQLKVENEGDPFKKLASDTEERLRAFKESVKTLPDFVRDTKIEQFNEQLQKAAQSDVFKLNLARSDRLNDLLAQQEQLRNGLAGLDRAREAGQQREAFTTRQFDLEQESRTLRGQRFSEAEALRRRVAELQSSLSGRFAAEAIEQTTRGVSGDVLDAAQVRNARIEALDTLASKEREDFQRQARIQQLQDESRVRQIASAQDALNQAQGPAQQTAALDKILAATSDIGKLTEDQRDIRSRALEQRIQIEPQAEAEKKAREDKQIASQDSFTEGLNKFAVLLAKGLGIEVTVTDKNSTTRSGITSVKPSPYNSRSSVYDVGGGSTDGFKY